MIFVCHECVRHDSFTRDTDPFICDMTQLCVTWLIHMWHYSWAMPGVRISHATHMNIWKSHVTHTNDKWSSNNLIGGFLYVCHTYQWFRKHIWMNHVTRMNTSVTNINESTLSKSTIGPRRPMHVWQWRRRKQKNLPLQPNLTLMSVHIYKSCLHIKNVSKYIA